MSRFLKKIRDHRQQHDCADREDNECRPRRAFVRAVRVCVRMRERARASVSARVRASAAEHEQAQRGNALKQSLMALQYPCP